MVNGFHGVDRVDRVDRVDSEPPLPPTFSDAGQLALVLGKDGNVAFAEQLSKTGLATALDVYGDDEEHPDYKRLAGLYGWLTTMGDAGDNPVGDIMGTFM